MTFGKKTGAIASLIVAFMLLGLIFGCTQGGTTNNISSNTDSTVTPSTTINSSTGTDNSSPSESSSGKVIPTPEKDWIYNKGLYYTAGSKDLNSYNDCVAKEGLQFQVTEIWFDFENLSGIRDQFYFSVAYDSDKKKDTAFSYIDNGEKKRITSQIDDCWNKVTINAYNYRTKELVDSQEVIVAN